MFNLIKNRSAVCDFEKVSKSAGFSSRPRGAAFSSRERRNRGVQKRGDARNDRCQRCSGACRNFLRAHNGPVRQRQENGALARKNRGAGGGLGKWGGSAPSLPCLVIRCAPTPQEPLTYSRPTARHAGPRGRRTSPACGSCRRPLKSNEKQGIEESNGGKKKYSASKEGTLRPSREGTKCIIFLPILER